MAWHLLGMLSTSFSAYSVGRKRHTPLVCRESCFVVNARLPASFLFTTLHTFSIEFAPGDCEGQSEVVMSFAAFQDDWGRCPLEGSNPHFWLQKSSLQISEGHVRRF